RHGQDGVAARVLVGSIGTGDGVAGGDGGWQLPEHPAVVVDSDYVLAAVGLLADVHPDTARRLAASLLASTADRKVHG
uniref:glutamate mutase L n=1 Tax=Nocardioides sp. TaxID=35761 RepID=UPI002B275C6E